MNIDLLDRSMYLLHRAAYEHLHANGSSAIRPKNILVVDQLWDTGQLVTAADMAKVASAALWEYHAELCQKARFDQPLSTHLRP